eukprot:scaffold109763_cov74-Phaeocystis_antarctica.AAC.3
MDRSQLLFFRGPCTANYCPSHVVLGLHFFQVHPFAQRPLRTASYVTHRRVDIWRSELQRVLELRAGVLIRLSIEARLCVKGTRRSACLREIRLCIAQPTQELLPVHGLPEHAEDHGRACIFGPFMVVGQARELDCSR